MTGRLEADDHWIAVDKLQHLLFCLTVFLASYIACTRFAALNSKAHSFALGLSLLAGLGKEAGDSLGVRLCGFRALLCMPEEKLPLLQFWPGAFSADLAGVGLGLVCVRLYLKSTAYVVEQDQRMLFDMV